ncbi:hypothetical protein Tsp_05281 [Trichinella spiralis]|uniref:hypothetical protein n=1 Tax=Trichinella spiralis TaxID=6334 RepID=UPI0001EFEC88|nr:hypothetical protein Tsp_05281 [Trichinella spiralis]
MQWIKIHALFAFKSTLGHFLIGPTDKASHVLYLLYFYWFSGSSITVLFLALYHLWAWWSISNIKKAFTVRYFLSFLRQVLHHLRFLEVPAFTKSSLDSFTWKRTSCQLVAFED